MNEIDRPYHRISQIFPLMQGVEFEELKADIKANGLLEPIWIDEAGAIIDGRNRHRACIETGTPPDFRTRHGDDLLPFVISLNLHRRHLSESQRDMVAAKIANMPQGARTDVEPCLNLSNVSQAAAAKLMNISRSGVQQAKQVIERGTPELIAAVENGELPVSRAIQEIKRAEVITRLESIEAQETKAIEGVYDVVVIDPPWDMKKIERDVAPNQVEFEYPTMTDNEIKELSIPCADNCHVWLWTTHKKLPFAFELLEVWGLRYVCTFTWHKPGGFQPFGLPQYNCEFALYARRGSPIFIETKQFNVCFNAPRGAHSEKPDGFYERVRRVTAGRRLDMFNRRPIAGFDGWGNEAK